MSKNWRGLMRMSAYAIGKVGASYKPLRHKGILKLTHML